MAQFFTNFNQMDNVMKKIRTLAVLNALFFIVHVSISYFTQFKLINNQDVGEVSDNYTSLFTPAGITFAIWGLIYLALLAFAVYHLAIAFKRDINHPANSDLSRIGPWFIINNIATAAWLIVWTNELLLLSVLLIFIQLISLIIINLRLPIYDRSREIASKIFTQFPLSIYFAWLTIATIANTSTYLASVNFSAGIDAVTWTIIMISIAVMITAMVVFLRRNIFYGLVVIWALYGIILKREAVGGNGEAIMNTAWSGIIVTAVVCIVQLLRNNEFARTHITSTIDTQHKQQL